MNTVRDAADVDRGRLATKEDIAHFATKADVYQVALGIVIANAMITFALLKRVP